MVAVALWSWQEVSSEEDQLITDNDQLITAYDKLITVTTSCLPRTTSAGLLPETVSRGPGTTICPGPSSEQSV